MVLVYVAFAFAFRIMMVAPGPLDPHKLDLTGDLMMNFDIRAEIIQAVSIIDGSFDAYTGRYAKEVAPGTGVAISYPPLMAYLQVPIVYAGMRAGLKPLGMDMIMLCGLPYIVLGGLLALQAGAVLKGSLGVSDEMTVTAAVFLLLFSSLMFWVVTYSARFEFVGVLFLLLAMSSLTKDRYGLAGLCIGLALMTKHTLLPAVVVFIAVLFLSTLRREVKAGSTVRLIACVPLPFVILIPFVMASPRDVWIGLFRTQAMLTIGEVTFVNAVLQVGKTVFNEEPLRQFLKLHSSSIIMAICVGFVFVVASMKKVRFGTNRFCALVALASFFLPVLGKYTNIDRYVVVPSVFVILWGASRRPGLPYDALWFVMLQSFILDHVPVIWKQYVGLIFYAIVFAYIYYMAFEAGDNKWSAAIPEEVKPGNVDFHR